MIEFDPNNGGRPFVVGVGLIIATLFTYGKKVRRRVHITGAELLGDLMQFGVRLVITMGTIQAMEYLGWKITGAWQLVSITILIATSFDSYLAKIRELVIGRFLGAAEAAVDVALGKVPNGAYMRIPAGSSVPTEIKVALPPEGEDDIKPSLSTTGTMFRRSIPASRKTNTDFDDLIGELDKKD